jgi:hypothetical protein
MRYFVYNSETKGIRVIYVKQYSFVPVLAALLLISFCHHWAHVISTLQFEFTSCDVIMHICVIHANTVIVFCDNSLALDVVCCTVMLFKPLRTEYKSIRWNEFWTRDKILTSISNFCELYIHLLPHSFVHSFIHSFIYSFIHSFIT